MTTATDRMSATELAAFIDTLADGRALVATEHVAPVDVNGNALRAVIVYAIPTDTDGSRPYPVPVAAASGYFTSGYQHVAEALASRMTGEGYNSLPLDAYGMVRDRVSVLPSVQERTQTAVKDRVTHAANAIKWNDQH